MKKTLLMAAATLAAGIISSQAQVYSQNVVGYINQPIPANRYEIVGSQLVGGSDVGQSNGDINSTLGAGLISSPVPVTGGNPGQDPGLSTNTQILVFNGVSFTTYFYFNQADATSWQGAASPAGWYTAGGVAAAANLTAGKAAFIYNHSSFAATATTVGTVRQGTNVVSIAPGFNLLCLQEPISTNTVVDGNGNALSYGLPIGMTSSNCIAAAANSPTTTTQDSIQVWNGVSFTTFFYFNQADATSWENSYGAGPTFPAGFYDAGGTAMPAGNYPTVNQGFFLKHLGSAINWTNSFTVQ